MMIGCRVEECPGGFSQSTSSSCLEAIPCLEVLSKWVSDSAENDTLDGFHHRYRHRGKEGNGKNDYPHFPTHHRSKTRLTAAVVFSGATSVGTRIWTWNHLMIVSSFSHAVAAEGRNITVSSFRRVHFLSMLPAVVPRYETFFYECCHIRQSVKTVSLMA